MRKTKAAPKKAKSTEKKAKTVPRKVVAEQSEVLPHPKKALIAVPPEKKQRPSVVVVVQARDGRWVYGAQEDEAALVATKKGAYRSAADASQAATEDHDIVINTAPPEVAKPKQWDLGQATRGRKKKTAGAKGIGTLCLELIAEGKSNDEVLAAVRGQYPDARTSVASVNWYRNKAKKA